MTYYKHHKYELLDFEIRLDRNYTVLEKNSDDFEKKLVEMSRKKLISDEKGDI